MNCQPFIPAEELKRHYGVFGHFYSMQLPSKEVIECRSVLEIAEHGLVNDCNRLSKKCPDAVFIMMNPGSSQPLVEVSQLVKSGAIHKLEVALVPTKPDTTQYQVMRIMHFRGWRHVRVLNLSDVRSPMSADFIKTFQRLENDFGLEAHSVFSGVRQGELRSKLPRSQGYSIVFAWGVNVKLAPLIARCLKRLPKKSECFGLLQPKTTDGYRHPLPSLHEDQRRWVDEMMEQLEEEGYVGELNDADTQ